MPIEGYFKYDDGEIDEIPAIGPGEIFYFADYSNGEVNRVVGIHCPLNDVGGNIHVIDDEYVLEHASPETIGHYFSEATQCEWLVPNSILVIQRQDRNNRCGNFVIEHTLPNTLSMN